MGAYKRTRRRLTEPTPKTRLFPGDLTPLVAERSGLPESLVMMVVQHYLAVVSDELAEGKEIVFPNTGTILRCWLESPGPLPNRLQLRFRPAEKLRKALRLYKC